MQSGETQLMFWRTYFFCLQGQRICQHEAEVIACIMLLFTRLTLQSQTQRQHGPPKPLHSIISHKTELLFKVKKSYPCNRP
jgi:hypothetical protein